MLFALVLTQSFAAKDKPSCNARELSGQDCRLVVGSYKIRLLADTIARDDGTWHLVDAMPLKGEGIVWEKVTFEIKHATPVLQFWLWDQGQGETKVQALHWYVADARKGALKILEEGIVRRRRLKPNEDPNAKPTFIHDGWEPHALKILPHGKLEWTLGAAKRTLSLDH